MLDYATADRMLGSRQCRNVPNITATSLVRLTCGVIGIRYHSTVVVAIYPDGTYTLHTGGYHTVTTKRRINAYSPARLYQQDFGWYLASGGDWTDVHEFVDGIRIDSAGVVV